MVGKLTHGELEQAIKELKKEPAECKQLEEVMSEREEIYRILTEESPLGVAIISKYGAYQYLNPKFIEMFGYTLKDIPTGREWFRKAYPDKDYRSQVIAAWIADLTGYKRGESRPQSYKVKCKDGSEKLTHFRPVTMESGEQFVVYEDITERNQAEKALKEANEIINRSSSVVFTWKNQKGWPVEFVSENVEKLFGYTAEEFMTGEVNYAGCIHPEDLKQVTKEVAEFSSKAETTEFIHTPYRIIAKDGSEKIITDWTYIVRDNDGRITHHKGLIGDITERKRAEEALRESEMKFRFLAEGMMDILWTLDLNFRTTYVSPSIVKVLGFTPEERIRQEAADMMTPESYARVVDTLAQEREIEQEGNADPDRARIIEIEYYHKDGNTVWTENVVRGIRDHDGNLVGIHGVSRDITERKQSEEALKESEERYKTLFEEALDGICIADAEAGTIIDCNRALAALVGRERAELIGQPQRILHLPYDDQYPLSPTFKQHLIDKEGQSLETQVVTSNGTIREVEIKANRVDVLGRKALQGVFRDITEQRQAEQEKEKLQTQLQRALKMEAIGRLTAGVAHEILNPVNIISLRLQLVKKAEDLSDPTKKALDICTSQLNRITEILKELGQFSHISKEYITMSDLNTVIGHVLTLYEPQLKVDNIKTDIQFYPDLPKIPLDQDRLGQVIFNIIANASDAMAEQENKMLRIITKPAASQDYMQVIISDTGTGIERSDMDKIFEPYFTTKDKPQDTGLGLFISYNTIQDHGGRIWAENNAWGGASFFIELPVSRDINVLQKGDLSNGKNLSGRR